MTWRGWSRLRDTFGEFRRETKGGHLCIRELALCTAPFMFRFRALRERLLPILEITAQQLGHRRLRLPEFMMEDLFPGFDAAPIQLTDLPRGICSTPIPDQVVLAKLVRAVAPSFMLEAGSFRGYTARLIAQNLPPEATLYTVDIDPNHGEAYGATSVGNIRRFVGPIDAALPERLGRSTFDFIFLDANHQRSPVEEDTAALLPLLADDGVFVWHDYSDWGWVTSNNRVPEVLCSLAEKIPILVAPCTALAVYRKSWSRVEVDRAVTAWREQLALPESSTRRFNNPPITNAGTL